MANDRPVCVVVGVGPGNGAALARRFAKEGHAVALLARSTDFSQALAKELPHARAYACDASDPAALESTFASIERELGEVEVLVLNAGSGVWGSVEEVSPADFESAWRINALGPLVACQRVIPGMKRRGRGSIVFIGATASKRGGPKSAAFAAAKAAQRSLAESTARSLWPAGIHVSLIVVDGVVDLPRTRQRMPEQPDSFFIRPEGVAETALQLTRQDRSAWSFEVEARPFAERW
ncbi:SDR family NAD(P)-dependent oxidoreductase [Aggregicoccus sp. 17bor-14]|uniref:SDR family NAD(P)-dependent oxidoreductase n=1 Tax=Myxococcaceae TaxID=31 RepID=UPI00129C1ACF|nr:MULTISPECIES: SDR family NAD(P)-dependent oxidoreductase [Myxococcaceae]MBF5046530.1 SDR family NAD(P)-dependent oxidoreductase [Simulacricoccus sp. 17bor-14]MRI92243.1 SDR family NAD(P)-dependent oxidoreductase [Aggregicoccus sp. 17bor-14]